jgi:GTP-binding protein EngB required for normal cell division
MNQKPSLLIIGNSNVGKSSITRLLLPNIKLYKGKTGKKPGSTLQIKPISNNNLSYQIVDLPGFGYMKSPSRRREEHIKKQIVIHIEKHYNDYFFGLVVINILRIEDEIRKYFVQNKKTIPLSFELIQFLSEFNIPLLIILNKIDKMSNFDKHKIIKLLVNSAKEYGLNLISFDESNVENKTEIPFLEFSALKKINLDKLKQIIKKYLEFF